MLTGTFTRLPAQQLPGFLILYSSALLGFVSQQLAPLRQSLQFLGLPLPGFSGLGLSCYFALRWDRKTATDPGTRCTGRMFFVPGPNSESYGKTWGCSGELTPLFEHLLGGGISDRLCLVAPGYTGTLALLQHLPVWDQ